ncbi:MAG: hypothetical protein IKM35_03350 [Bacteroidaceae bacterium]|nr:hypothetical protein [Bacteroidaceae bacterium]
MAVRRNLIVSVIAVLLLVCGIMGLCLFYLSNEQNEREMYLCCKVSHYISQPADACIYLVNDVKNVQWSDLPNLPDSLLPPPSVWGGRIVDVTRPLYIARYSSGDVVLWCAASQDDVCRVIDGITTLLCDGYAPVEEVLGQGRMYHFATRENSFLHLYAAPGIMGCSYRERLLVPHDVDTALASFIDEVQRLSHCGVVYYAGGYHYNDIHLAEDGCDMRWVQDDCIEGLGDAMMIDTTLISRRAMMAVQLQLSSHHQALSSVFTLAYMPSVADGAMPDVVLSVPIVQPDVLSLELLSVHTPYGYRADSVAMRRWFIPELITAEQYWLTARDGILFASPSPAAMWSYATDLHRGCHYRNGGGLMSTASLFVVGDSVDVDLLPLFIARELPPYVSSASLIQVVPCNRGYRYRVRCGGSF